LESEESQVPRSASNGRSIFTLSGESYSWPLAAASRSSQRQVYTMSKKLSLSDDFAQHKAGLIFSIALPRTASSVAPATEKANPTVAQTTGEPTDKAAIGAAMRPSDHDLAPAWEQSPTQPLASGQQLGTTVVSEPSPKQSQIFEEEFNLSRELIKSAGIQAVNYTPAAGERVATFYDKDRRECVPCSLENQWIPPYRSLSYVYVPPIPRGESLRVPVRDASKQIVGYIYYRLRPRYGGGHEIEMYRPTHTKRQIDYGFADLFPVDPEGLVVVDNIFQSLHLQRQGYSSVSLGGMMSYGFSAEGYFPFDRTIEKRGDSWRPRDTQALAELLTLREVMEWQGYHVLILCERDWLMQTDFKKSQFFHDQMTNLCKIVSNQDLSVAVFTSYYYSSREAGLSDLDHSLATDWFDNDYYSSDHHVVVASDLFADDHAADDHHIVEMCALTA
jgi:hypothetical protein